MFFFFLKYYYIYNKEILYLLLKILVLILSYKLFNNKFYKNNVKSKILFNAKKTH